MRPRELALLVLLAAPALAEAPRTITVRPQGPSLVQALEEARDGDRILVQGGVHAGPIVVSRRITLEGEGWPVIDGAGRGTVVKLAAAGAVLRGFVVRNSGASLDDENSGITVDQAPGARVEGNRLEETLFGISVARSPGAVVSGNDIRSKALDVARRGDPIRVWYSDRVRLERNVVTRGRDVVLWYSSDLTVTDNAVTDGRYGLHFMYCDDADIERNRLVGNSVGVYLMYSRRLRMTANAVVGNRGPSGYGLGLKDMDDCVVGDNLFADNRVGAWVDNSPREPDSELTFRGNLIAGNDEGVALLPSVRGARFTGNAFVDNGEQVAVQGAGVLSPRNLWSVSGRGNFWSDYAGYDQDRDGVGDVRYRSERLFESLAQRRPELRLFVYSPAAQAIELAGRALPVVRPQPKLVDEAPLVAPPLPRGLPAGAETGGTPLVVSSSGLVALALCLVLIPGALLRERRAARTRIGGPVSAEVVRLEGVTKRFGQAVALEALSLTIRPGEAVAFWGANGAGKTTALRCLLGIVPFEGQVLLAGHDVRRDGKGARRHVGFVPQELAFHDDPTVAETVAFYARLKGVPAGAADALLARLELVEHAKKAVRQLSGGLKQRLAVALALLGDPPVLVLDEPTANLDAPARASLVALLAQLKAQGKTLVFTSHRLEEVLTLADRVIVLERGRLVADASPRELGERLRGQSTLHLLLAPGVVERAEAVLVGAGYAPEITGAGLSVDVDPGDKGRPVALLLQAGLPVADFEVARALRAGRS